jgi:lipoprotein NlpD
MALAGRRADRVALRREPQEPHRNRHRRRRRREIRAAADGEVVYSGSGLIGYGKLIILKHNDSYLSAYGYNQALQVKEGEQVKSGQVIALMGRGPADRPLLHFEIRVDGKPVDPARLLPPR